MGMLSLKRVSLTPLLMTQFLLYVQGGSLKSADAWASFQTKRMQRDAAPEYQRSEKAPQMTL